VSGLNPARFAEFYRALHGSGYAPFPWQERLIRRVAAGTWPSVIALPTAAGKTACIDIAVFALACQAGREGRTAPRRIFFVVDRRVIVDQAFARARTIADKLRAPEAPILREIAGVLCGLARSDRPLDCFQLRGGIYRDDAWARTPLQPTVIASTVDQVGSRLLFRGYGLRSGAARPIHAGLAGNDSLILLDEAHCARPFGQTACAVARYRAAAELRLPSPFQVVRMTATPDGDVPEAEFLRDEEDDRNDPVLGRRIGAPKPARLVVADKAKGQEWRRHLAAELARQAESLMKEPVRAVGVIVNRVATAREVHALLSQDQGGRAEIILLTGRMRPLDRDRVVARWLSRLESGHGAALDRPVFVVATQCLEVGADLDFHALVTECASLDALRQRFGRLNRVAARDFSPACVVVRADQTAPAEEAEGQDPIYGNGLALTWQWLQANATDGVIDMGVAATRDRWEVTPAGERGGLTAPAPNAPVLFPSHLDCWAQTDPVPCPDPDPSVFLHGPRQAAPDVQVVWRDDLAADRPGDWAQVVSLCPPSSSEAMPVPLAAFRRWLGGDDDSPDDGDVEGTPGGAEGVAAAPAAPRVALRWWGPDADETAPVSDPRDIRPGDTLVLPVAAGGWEVLGHIPPSDDPSRPAALDLGDESYQRSRDVALVRLTPALVARWPAELQTEDVGRIVAEPELMEEREELSATIDAALADLAVAPAAPDWLRSAASALAAPRGRTVEVHPAGGVVLRGARRLSRRDAQPAFTDEDDTASGLDAAPGGRVTLGDHCRGVEAYARAFAVGCGLPAGVVEAVAWAARWHDLGKADRRFQALLRNLPRRAVAAGPPLLAKSSAVARSARARQLARERSGYPKGARHELLSVRLAESRLERLPPALDRDLLLHLIASHHGRCRPFAPVVDDPRPEAIPPFDHEGERFGADSTATGLERLDSGVPERFWRLVRVYGWWGLAYLEAVLRLADHRRSEHEQSGPGGQRA
jgi:CRISPR-associated endonuclease/helicase Cas3